MLKKLKSSKATGYDVITTHFIKGISDVIAPHITHLINSIIRTGTVPKAFKTSRITPISKSSKPPNLISSFRPLNNLICLNKVFEHYYLSHLNKFLSDNNIINKTTMEADEDIQQQQLLHKYTTLYTPTWINKGYLHL